MKSLRNGIAKRYPPFDHGKPIWRPNVALVAGVLMIPAVISMAGYSAPTHAVVVDLPVPLPFLAPPHDGPVQRISVTATGEPVVNGLVADAHQFADHLEWLATQEVAPEVVFEPAANAPYDASLKVLAALHSQGLTRFPLFCFGGLERHRHFDRGDRTSTLLSERSNAPPFTPSCTAGTQPVF